MGKLISWVVMAALGYLAYRLILVVQRKAIAQRTGAAQASVPGGTAGRSPTTAPRELMRQCDVCGTHVPGSDALQARGRFYCSVAHRDQGA